MHDSSDGLQVWCAGEEWCPVTSTATLICRKWHPVIIHRLLNDGPLGFSALQDQVDGVSSKVLSDSLEDLQEKKLIERSIVSEQPFRVEYSLTERGSELEPVVSAMENWGKRHLQPPEDEHSGRF
ncbi:helix-turn-helix transcriptional regulator [Halomicroarcula sp. F13]|uniref:Helix-turn-helix transcriptional regulator n=1 Tax=Haloarcula rubra TaxID=2487747 RepID=A0AAW4PWH5_9EURY|nr:helix-turn-helix domain-containing protein [Halomicroarcula rubra]MBX0325517.1 helix-turn-helix transcriptional regulator [Halomicroarcula rubra]